MKYCPKCGNELTEGVKFCAKCGSEVNNTGDVNDSVNQNAYQNVNQTYSGSALTSRREIALAIILSFVTCGIYGIYWFIVMTDDINRVSGDENGTSGGMAFLFSLLTCGIYTFYWNYKMGKQIYEAGRKHGKEISDNAILYLILSLFGFGIINYCLLQNDLNKFAN